MKADQAAELNAVLIIGLILLGVIAWLLLGLKQTSALHISMFACYAVLSGPVGIDARAT